MGRYEFEAAREIFAQLVTRNPDRLELQVNLAIATLNRQRESDDSAAQVLLERVIAANPRDLRARYNLGLLLLNAGKPAEAIGHFRFVVDERATDAYATYYAAQCAFQQADYEGALRGYERARTLDPHLRSAVYGSFQTLQRLGRTADAQRSLEAFQDLERNPQSRTAEFKYTRMGPLSEVTTIDAPVPTPASRPTGPVVASAVAPLLAPGALPAGWTWRARSVQRPPSITAVDIDGDSRLDLFIAGAFEAQGRPRNAVLFNREAGFVVDAAHPLATVSDVNAALWGDYDNDGFTDVYLCRRGANQLWRQGSQNQWTDVTAGARAAGPGGDTVDGAFVDADHEGDLDVFLVRADGPNELLNNNGDGTFRPIARQAGVAGDGRPSTGLVVADLDGDRDLDLIVLKAQATHDVFINDRLWRYRRAPGFARFVAARIHTAVAGDADADGRMEIYASDAEGVARWMADRAGEWVSERVAGTAAIARSPQLALGDMTGDGRLNLVSTVATGGWQVNSITGDQATAVVAATSGPALVSWALAVLTSQDGPSVVALPAEPEGAALLWRPGSGRWPFVALSFTGRDSKSDQTRSNASGIGTSIAARTDSRWTTLSHLRSQSGPGQSLQPLAIGTGGAARVDFVSMTWSDGVLQTEIALDAGRLHRIEETQRQLSSCPVLFAFDGERYAFVTDVLGVGGVGFLERPGVYSAARPRENLLLPVGLLAAQNGRYHLKITEPMEEVLYLDAARLVAYDLPPGWEMTLDERKEIGGPVPSGEPRYFQHARLPVRAVSGEGENVTAAITAVDGVAAPPGRVDSRFIGRTDDHTLTLEFDRSLDEGPGVPMLVADGWVEYPYAQTIFAAWQAGAAYLAPSIEARAGTGRWQRVLKEFGYPAGMPRQMSVPLHGLPRGTTALRLHTTQEIYWDRLAIANAEAPPRVIEQRLALQTARLATTGHARRSTGTFRRPSYDYDARVPLWDTRHLKGFYTTEGPVDELVASEDDAVAILGPGEEVHLEFSARTDPPPPGWTRRYVLELRGWCKDMDMYTEHGETVDPVPATAAHSSSRTHLHQKFNTRYESGQ